jgi:hypothetical protein
MQKIISLFERNYDGDRLVRNSVTPGAEWVQAGEGVPTRKFDGTCCLVRDGKLYKRYEVKRGGKFPGGFEPSCDMDPFTGKLQGWVPVGDGPEDRWHREAWDLFLSDSAVREGTFELCGPKVNGNPERLSSHVLIPHGDEVFPDCPRDFMGLADFLRDRDVEGIVWHNKDGRMAKLKKRDFGFRR